MTRDQRDLTIGALVLAAVVLASLVGAYFNDQHEKREAAEMAARAQARAAEEARRSRDFEEKKAEVKATILAAIAGGRLDDARTLLDQYRPISKGALAVLDARLEVAKIPADQPIALEGAYEALVRLEPDNPRWKSELAAAQRAVKAYRAKLALEQKRADQAELARRRREGVSIGMTQRDVLLSSWGRPERVNRSTYAFGEHEQWVYGSGNYLYFENGVLRSIQTSR
jgi:hypothetical protein